MSNRFPLTVEERYEAFIKSTSARLRVLEQLAVLLEPGCLVTAYTGTIPGTYTSGKPTVTLASGTVLGPLDYLKSYTPAAGDTVLCVPAGQSYIVVGALA